MSKARDPTPATCLEDVLITHELARRPWRPPDYEAENRALTDLARALASEPKDVLQMVVEVARDLCNADSAGISILEPGDGTPIFRWHAIAGAFAAHVMGALPQDASPCGEVLGCDTVLLFSTPDRFFPALRDAEPRIYEALLAPWATDGEPLGTLWLLAHRPDRHFDTEDARLLTSIAGFAAAAWRTSLALAAADSSRAELRRRVDERTAALRASEERSRSQNAELLAVLESLNDALYIGDKSGIHLANQAALDQLGFASREELNRSIGALADKIEARDADTGALIPASEQAFARALAGERVVQDVLIRHRLTGEDRIVRCAASPAVIDGQVIAAVAVNTDVTEQRALTAKLRESEERLRAIVEEARDYAIFTTDRDNRIADWMPGAEAVLGWSADEAIGQTVDMTFTPEDRAAGEPGREFAGAREHGYAADVRWHLRKDGERVYIDGSMRARRAPDGDFVGALKIGRDVTERWRAEQALRESDERFRQFADASPDVLWIRDAETLAFEYVSPAFETLYGVSLDDVLGGDDMLRWVEIIHPDDRDRALANIERVRRGERVDHEFRVLRPSDGQVRWVYDADFPLLDGHGRVQRIGGVGKDITELRRATEALRASEARAKLLLAELQHRVRNTLAVIRSIARRTAETTDTVEDYAMHLEGRLDAFARVQSVVTRDPGAGVDLEQLVAGELLAHAAHEGGQVERIKGPRVRLHAKAAETMALAIHELATNAVKHGALAAENGRVRVEWRFEAADGETSLHFDWTETGVKLARGRPARQGFGTELIERTLEYELDGEASLLFAPSGLRCTIRLPVNDRLLLGADRPGEAASGASGRGAHLR